MPIMKVDDWYSKNLLDIIFEKGLSLNTSPASYFFDQIYAPIRTPTASGMPDSYTYQPVGFTYGEVADIYAAHYGGNFWPERYEDAAELNAAIADYKCKILQRIVAILTENTLKYKKLIELQGYSWCPLWNVDGTELHATIEQHADEVTNTGTDTTTDRSVAPYDSSTMKKQYSDHTTGTAANNVRTVSHTQSAHSVAASDNAFGESLTGGDIYHAEKTVRQGNIGVTQTSALIENARSVLRWCILEEFFRDINKVLLIGIY